MGRVGRVRSSAAQAAPAPQQPKHNQHRHQARLAGVASLSTAAEGSRKQQRHRPAAGAHRLRCQHARFLPDEVLLRGTPTEKRTACEQPTSLPSLQVGGPNPRRPLGLTSEPAVKTTTSKRAAHCSRNAARPGLAERGAPVGGDQHIAPCPLRALQQGSLRVCKAGFATRGPALALPGIRAGDHMRTRTPRAPSAFRLEQSGDST